MDVFDVMATCRAMRHLRPDPVPDELIEQLLWAATRAPSPGNSQGWDFVVVDDAAKKRPIAEAVRAAMTGRIGAMRSDDPAEQRIFDGAMALVDGLDAAPVWIIVAGPVVYPPAAPREQFVWSALYPAAQNILLAARALGLGAVMTTFHHSADATIREVLGIPAEIRIGALIPIGWPEREFGPVRRRPVAEVTHRNGW